MGVFNNIVEGVRKKMQSFLQIDEASPLNFTIEEELDEQGKVAKNKIWYRGQTSELSAFYKQLPNKSDTFWGSVPTHGLEIRKIHTGIASAIVDTLTDIVISDYNGIEFKQENVAIQDLWSKIEKENDFNELLKDAISKGLYLGTGAFKISLDSTISKLPILEYFPKDRIEINKKRGRIREIIFKTIIQERNKKYLLKEIYGYGYIKYELYRDEKQVELNSTEQTAELENIAFDNSFMLAKVFKIEKDAIYDKKTDNFDALDEAWSQWMNALRDGRTKTYIPECLIPKNPNGGYLLNPNSFDNKFIKVDSDLTENADNKIITDQPEIKTDAYMNTYITALDLCLQRLISPSTLGIDTKKVTDPNATAQREKEKTTLYTRGKIVEAINNCIPELINNVFKAYYTAQKEVFEDIEVIAKFGEYANPSFEAQVETVAKAKQGLIMSLETSVDELYGDSKTKDWKEKEVERLKAEQGIITDVAIPQVGGVINENNK